MRFFLITASTSLLSVLGQSSYCRPLANGIVSNCGSTNDAFKIEAIELNPSKPTRNATNHIRIVGEVKQTIEEGAKVNVTIFHDGTKYEDAGLDLCKHLVKTESIHKCPIEPTEVDVTTQFLLPGFMPEGPYEIDATGFNKDKQIFNIKFSTIIK